MAVSTLARGRARSREQSEEYASESARDGVEPASVATVNMRSHEWCGGRGASIFGAAVGDQWLHELRGGTKRFLNTGRDQDMLSRRRFVYTVVSLGVFGPGLSGKPSAAQRSALPSLQGRLSKDVFLALRQQTFTAVIDHRRVRFMLVKVSDDGC